MKLFSAPVSPFVRKAVLAVHELGLNDKVEIVKGDYNDESSDLFKCSPIGKIPAMAASDGINLCDSQLIVAYLDAQSDQAELLPASGSARWEALASEALADGLMDAGVDVMREVRRPEGTISSEIEQKFRDRAVAVLDRFEQEAASYGDEFHVGRISLLCALDYFSFRFADMEWQKGRPNLVAWHAKFTDRASAKATHPATWTL
jgi:glutathione S-transferase